MNVLKRGGGVYPPDGFVLCGKDDNPTYVTWDAYNIWCEMSRHPERKNDRTALFIRAAKKRKSCI